MTVGRYVPAGMALMLLASCLPASSPPRTASANPARGRGGTPAANGPPAPDRMPPASASVNDQRPRPLVMVDSASLELAEATGGLVTAPSLVRSTQGSFDLFGSATTVVRLALVRSASSGSQRVPFVVDSTMGRVTVQVKGSPDLTSTLADPSGNRITPIEWPSSAIVYVVVNPRPGPWRVEVTAAKDAPLSVEVQAMTPVNCRVTLKERTVDAGTNAWQDVHHGPLVGREYLLVAELREQMTPLGSVSDVELGIARSTGPITWLRTLPPPPGESTAKWYAEAVFRAGDRVVIRGRFAGGEAFLRESAAVRPVEF